MNINIFAIATIFSIILFAPLIGDQNCKRWDRRGLKDYIKYVSKQHQWHLSATGAIFDEIETIQLSFTSRQMATLPQARRLLVNQVLIAADFLGKRQGQQKLNQNGPFTYHNLCYSIYFETENGKSYVQPYMYGLSLLRGRILYYQTTSPDTPYEIIFEESFEDALRIVEEESKCS
jgi:hypothetical protein